MHYPAFLTALAALASFSAATPNGWSSTKSADDGPNKLDECGCWPIYQAMLTCQKLPKNIKTSKPIRDCVCIPNPDGWYTSMNGCRECLSPGSLEDNDFFDNLSRTITQLFVSCTEAGGGVSSDGESICASNYYHEACASLKTDGQPSWASYEVFASDDKGNGTFVLDISENGGAEESSATGTTALKTSTASSTTAATSSATTAGASETTAGTTVATSSGTETTSALSTTTAPSSAMGYAGSRWSVERVVGLWVAMGVVAALF
ncbi:hypothetical protein C8A01DRAFT_37640 [Parachaetomium inaequale]|uniref:Uncharacterized protein n=1 Tax=Parachaetomium inaequale TaxID=2588326 RepID=A0AAN6PD51_9PEZI|nr:hypothetical protein C8A01DRAFT_37640 [Parachaetomium inaequale]